MVPCHTAARKKLPPITNDLPSPSPTNSISPTRVSVIIELSNTDTRDLFFLRNRQRFVCGVGITFTDLANCFQDPLECVFLWRG